MRLKIAVSAVRFCPWPPHGPSGYPTGGPTPRWPAQTGAAGATAPRRQRSSAVEQPIRNRQVVGSNPTVGSRRPRPGPCLGGVSFRPARGWGPVPVPVTTPAATLHPARGTAPTLAARWAVGKVVRHVVFAASVALYVVVVGQNWAHYTAALLAQVWVRYRGELGAVPLTIGGGPAYLLPGR